MRYGAAGGAFAKVHRDFVLGGEGAIEVEAIDLARYHPREVERGRRSFVLRALDEQRSLLAFSELLTELCEAGADLDVIGSLTRVVRDEAAHVDLCQRVVGRLGGWPGNAPEPNWVRSDRRLPLRERILRTVIASLCIGETVSVAMIAGVRESATDPVVAQVLTQMLADESFHSRFGWWWLDRYAPTLTDEEHASLARWVPRVLDGVVKQASPTAAQQASAASYAPSPFGSMAPSDREAALSRALSRHIVPGLRRAGIDVGSRGESGTGMEASHE